MSLKSSALLNSYPATMPDFSKHEYRAPPKDYTVIKCEIVRACWVNLDGQMQIFEGPEGSTLISERNKRALEVLKREIDRGRHKLAIFYGAGHMPDMAQRLEKTAFSCCGAEGFDAAVCTDNRTQWILCGMEAHVCVLQTALELHARGLEVFVVEDGVCSRTDANHANALARLRQAGVIVSNTESVLFEWLRDAGDPQFKALSALIR